MLPESRAWQPASAVVLGMVWHEDEDTDTESFQLEATSAPATGSRSWNMLMLQCRYIYCLLSTI